MLKLARGHAAHELNEPQRGEPTRLGYAPLRTLDTNYRREFEAVPLLDVWPEVGSRAMQRTLVVTDSNGQSIATPGWIIVQPGQYRYLAIADESVTIRIVIAEYLAAEVAWT